MNLTKITAIAIMALLVTAGAAAAAPGNAPDHASNEGAGESGENQAGNGNHALNASENGSVNNHADRAPASPNLDENESAAGEANEMGPPGDLPSQVPEHVTQIHDLIRQHISGVLDGLLGHAVSNVPTSNASQGSQ